MALEIFWFSGSGFAWRAVLAAELKGVPYTSRLIEASAGDHRAPEFLAMNPRGKVPVLRDGDVVVTESMAILAYLDRRFPEPPLFGRTAEETARIWRGSFHRPDPAHLLRPGGRATGAYGFSPWGGPG